jgi:ribosome biogenesis GTPase
MVRIRPGGDLSKISKRKRIKANRKPKKVRDKSWKRDVLGGEIEPELEMPQTERIVPRGREEDRVKLWTKVEEEIQSETETNVDLENIERMMLHRNWRKGVVTQVSTSLYHVDLDKSADEPDAGLVDEEPTLCAVRGSLSASETGYTNVVAVGDEVLVSLDRSGDGVIEYVLPRRTVLARPDVVNPDMSQIIVSNVDQVLIVSSWEEPTLWLEMLDRYLIAAEEGKLMPLICLNKVDLASSVRECRKEMALYRKLGYTVILTSIVTGRGIAKLRKHLVGKRTVLAGRSGVGKSSLLMAVQPNLELRVAEVSDFSGEGRHTTTQVSLLRLEGGGYVVDTPGIRELGLITVHRHELVLYFPEIAALVGQCQFNDCSHTHEPGCAVVAAVEKGEIAWSRYASYLAIYEDLPEYYTE